MLLYTLRLCLEDKNCAESLNVHDARLGYKVSVCQQVALNVIMSPISFHTAVLWVPRHGAGAGVKPQHAFQRPTSLPNIDQLPHTQFSHFMHEGVTIYHPIGP